MARLSLDISDEFHHELKMLTAWKGISMKDFITKAINKQVKLESKPRMSKNIPNEETIRVIKESSQGINLNYYDSKEDFFKHLDDLQREVELELAKKGKKEE